MNYVISPKVRAHILAPNSDNPAVYVGTYRKYNEGSIFGAWLDLFTFDTYEEYLSICKALHYDEDDPEFMVQDVMGFDNGRGIASEWLDRDTFNHIRRLADFTEREKEIIQEFWDEVDGNEDPDSILSMLVYEGSFSDYSEILADDWLESLCIDTPSIASITRYFDYEAFERDVSFEYRITSNYVFES